jgi:hypothetical protein
LSIKFVQRKNAKLKIQLEVKFEHFLSFTIKNNKKNLSQQRSKFKNAPFLPFKFKNNLKRVPWHGRCIPVEQSDCTILVTFPGSLVQGNPACDLKIIDSFSFNSGYDLTVRCSKNIISYKHIVKYKFSFIVNCHHRSNGPIKWKI